MSTPTPHNAHPKWRIPPEVAKRIMRGVAGAAGVISFIATVTGQSGLGLLHTLGETYLWTTFILWNCFLASALSFCVWFLIFRASAALNKQLAARIDSLFVWFWIAGLGVITPIIIVVQTYAEKDFEHRLHQDAPALTLLVLGLSVGYWWVCRVQSRESLNASSPIHSRNDNTN